MADEGPEYTVHRLRIGNWIPSPITSIASDPFSPKVAIGHEDGLIEIVDSSNKWHVHVRIPGRDNFGLRALVWSPLQSQSGRLFGISTNGFIFEVSLSDLSIKSIRDTYGGVAYGLTASHQHSHLAVACEDGVGRVFDYEEVLEYKKSLPTTGTKVLSIAYHPNPPATPSTSSTPSTPTASTPDLLYLGCSDGTIRCIDEFGHSLYRMLGDVSGAHKGATVNIWSIIVLSDSTICTGDSRGRVQLWDGISGVLMISLHQHSADILALACSPDENQIFAAGVDSRTTCIRRVGGRPRGTSITDGPSFSDAILASEPTSMGMVTESSVSSLIPTDSHWVYTSSHRPHSHDVYSLSVCKHAKDIVLISGGLDCKLAIYSVPDFTKTRPVWVLPTPCTGLSMGVKGYRMLGLRHQKRVDLWELALDGVEQALGSSPWEYTSSDSLSSRGKKRKKTDSTTIPPPLPTSTSIPQDPFQLALQLQLKGHDHIHCSSLSVDGMVLAVSSVAGTRVWKIQRTGMGGMENDSTNQSPYTATLLQLPPIPSLKTLAHAITFTPDSRRLIVASQAGQIIILNLDYSYPGVKTTQIKPVGGSMGSVEITVTAGGTINHRANVIESKFIATAGPDRPGLESAISSMATSSDGAYLAVSDGQRRVYIYETDSLRMYWRLPILPSPTTCTAFHPSLPLVAVLLASNTYMIFDLVTLSLTPSSTQNHTLTGTAIEHSGIGVGPLQGIVFDPLATNRMVLYGQGVCIHVDLDAQVPRLARKVTPSVNGLSQMLTAQQRRKEAKRAKKEVNQGGGAGLAVTTDYRSIVHLGIIQGGHLVSTPTFTSTYSYTPTPTSPIPVPIRRWPDDWPLTQEISGIVFHGGGGTGTYRYRCLHLPRLQGHASHPHRADMSSVYSSSNHDIYLLLYLPTHTLYLLPFTYYTPIPLPFNTLTPPSSSPIP